MPEREPPLDNAVTVVMPVGPAPHHKRYLQEAVASVAAIPEHPQILLVDDMAGIEVQDFGGSGYWKQSGRELDLYVRAAPGLDVKLFRYRPPWRLGVPAAFNAGVALSRTQFSLMMGADDTLEPNVIQEFRRECPFPLGDRDKALLTLWGLPLRYMDTGEEQSLPNNAAIVSRELWKLTGGFHPASAVGACDTMLISAMIRAEGRAGRMKMLDCDPVYNYRRHAETETAGTGALQASIFEIRDHLTESWEPANWGRYL